MELTCGKGFENRKGQPVKKDFVCRLLNHSSTSLCHSLQHITTLMSFLLLRSDMNVQECDATVA
jgi:hypothetical protein